MIVRWPGKVAAGSVTDAMVEYVDVTPTFLDLAGAEAPSELDGKSFLPVLLGKTDQHKTHVFGEMTTRGIINGNDCYPIRSVRSRDYKLILNLKHDQKFTNACTRSDPFQSMRRAAEDGNEHAGEVVRRYQFRPAVEFYDVRRDPLEMTNLAGDPKFSSQIAELRSVLDGWMEAQGDRGVETELVANHHKRIKKTRGRCKRDAGKPRQAN